jgi:hypothetical protein
MITIEGPSVSPHQIFMMGRAFKNAVRNRDKVVARYRDYGELKKGALTAIRKAREAATVAEEAYLKMCRDIAEGRLVIHY